MINLFNNLLKDTSNEKFTVEFKAELLQKSLNYICTILNLTFPFTVTKNYEVTTEKFLDLPQDFGSMSNLQVDNGDSSYQVIPQNNQLYISTTNNTSRTYVLTYYARPGVIIEGETVTYPKLHTNVELAVCYYACHLAEEILGTSLNATDESFSQGQISISRSNAGSKGVSISFYDKAMNLINKMGGRVGIRSTKFSLT